MGYVWLHQLSLFALEALVGSLLADFQRHEEHARQHALLDQLSSCSQGVATVHALGVEIEAAGERVFVACGVGVAAQFEVAPEFESWCTIEIVLVELEPVRAQCDLTARSSKL